MILLVAIAGNAETQKPQDSTKPISLKAPTDVGIIFNTNSILLDLESYQAGLGAKLGWDDLYIRAFFDLVASGVSQTFALNMGATVEYHLLPEPLSLYVGGSLVSGYMTQENLTAATHFSLSAIVGVEYFPLEFISVFVEYALAADFTITKDLQSSQTTFDYLINTRMGNDSKLGIIIHLMRTMKK
jgi:hypothetical protein